MKCTFQPRSSLNSPSLLTKILLACPSLGAGTREEPQAPDTLCYWNNPAGIQSHQIYSQQCFNLRAALSRIKNTPGKHPVTAWELAFAFPFWECVRGKFLNMINLPSSTRKKRRTSIEYLRQLLQNTASRRGKKKKSLDLAGWLQCQDSALHYVKFEGSHKEKSVISKNEIHPTGSNVNIYFPEPVFGLKPIPLSLTFQDWI